MTATIQNEKRPLAGRTFLVTRTMEGNKKEREMLESMGAKVIELPTIEICPPSSWSAIDEAIAHIDAFDWIIFTSANGVRAFLERLRQVSGKKKLDSRFACVGPSTKAELERNGLKTSFLPSEFLTEKLGEELSRSFPLKGKRVLLARAEDANNDIENSLKKAGAILTEAPVYRTLSLKSRSSTDFTKNVTDITLTSPSTVVGLLNLIDAGEISSRNIRIHCIGPVTSKRAKDLGLKVESMANIHTIEGLLMQIASQKRGVT